MRALAVLLIAAALSLALSSGTAPADAAPERAPGASYNFSAVGDAIEDAVQTMPLPGASMMIVKDGELVYKRHFGDPPYDDSTAVFIASATKWPSAAAFMTLVDDGLVDLDDPVSMYLPEWTGTMGTITMRQLWSHTAGLPFDHACMADGSLTLAECVEQIRLTGLIAPPGTQFFYGGSSMQVAGRVAEVVTGQSWVTLFNERIATPLGMTSTTWFPNATPQPTNPRVPGGIRSTLGDYGKLMSMLLAGGSYNGAQILQPATVADMQADQTNGLPIAFSPHPDGRRYGIGEWRDIVDTNGDAVQLSSQGLFGFSPWLDVQRGYFAVFLVQDQFADVYDLVTELQQLTRDALDTPVSVGGDVVEPRVESPTASSSSGGGGRRAYTFVTFGAALAAAVAYGVVIGFRRAVRKGD